MKAIRLEHPSRLDTMRLVDMADPGEPKDGEIRLASEVPGKIVEGLGDTNGKVKAGDPLLRIDDTD